MTKISADQTQLKRCDCCRGLKRIKGLGSIEKTCPECNGVGWLEISILSKPKIEKELIKDNVSKNEVIIKKRGRPKKQMDILGT